MHFKNYKEQRSNANLKTLNYKYCNNKANQTTGITCSTNSSSGLVVCKLIIKK